MHFALVLELVCFHSLKMINKPTGMSLVQCLTGYLIRVCLRICLIPSFLRKNLNGYCQGKTNLCKSTDIHKYGLIYVQRFYVLVQRDWSFPWLEVFQTKSLMECIVGQEW